MHTVAMVNDNFFGSHFSSGTVRVKFSAEHALELFLDFNSGCSKSNLGGKDDKDVYSNRGPSFKLLCPEKLVESDIGKF